LSPPTPWNGLHPAEQLRLLTTALSSLKPHERAWVQAHAPTPSLDEIKTLQDRVRLLTIQETVARTPTPTPTLLKDVDYDAWVETLLD
jgi:hypothetical protein